MADPVIVTAVIAGIGAVFGVLVRDRIKGVEADRDQWKAAWKELADRDLRRRNSGPPPEDTRNIRLMVEEGSRQDHEDARQARMLQERAQGLEPSSPLEAFGPRVHPETTRELRRYAHPELSSTPPDPAPIIPEHRQRKRPP